ncbi:hypothetical protein KJ854_03925, partial [Patescibacteria group bacterium]|nr:hypothetical protein [Patescibacteria group bacterium]
GGGCVNRHKFQSDKLKIFEQMVSLENIFLAWQEFRKGKIKKSDVQEFEYNLEDNIFALHEELKTRVYQHSHYTSFYVQDPKLRKINKACVKDRVLHHAVFRILYSIFDSVFIFDSYSCRIGKGTHRAVNRLQGFAAKVGKNNAQKCYVLKCDIKKFFDSVNQDVLVSLIENKVKDFGVIWLVKEIIKSFSILSNKGLPLGNITSQLFANIYLNELDQFVKHRLKVKYYVRYSDDFVILSGDKEYLEELIFKIGEFLKERLELSFHARKVIIRKYRQGIDFLGYISLPYHTTLRVKTKRRIFRKIKLSKEKLKGGFITEESFNQSLQSYYGILKHCKGYKLKLKLEDLIKRRS